MPNPQANAVESPTLAHARTVLGEVFGHSDFRAGQKEVCTAVIGGADALVLMPTGGGKSLCYQVPMLVLSAQGQGITVVISPLIALMMDQVAALRAKGVAAFSLHSQLSPEERQRALLAIQNNTADIVYVSPETALRKTTVLQRARVSLLVIDEAHCVSMWGHDFRPEYGQLSLLRERWKAPCMALTATATPQVCEDIVNSLCLQAPFIYRGSFMRPNLRFDVCTVFNDETRSAALIRTLEEAGMRSSGHGKAIVYASSRRQVEMTASDLCRRGFAAGFFHGGLDHEQRRKCLKAYELERTPVLVATNAFGMGMDHPNVRLVVHRQSPGSLAAYYQEAGRAGRDGAPARCVLLFHNADIEMHAQLMRAGLQTKSMKSIDAACASRRTLSDFVHSTECRQVYMAHYFAADVDAPLEVCRHCDNCVSTEEPFVADHIGFMEPQADLLSTAELELIVDAVAELLKPVGRHALAQALKGSRKKRLRMLGLQNLSQHGKLAHHQESAICTSIDWLMDQGRIGRGMGDYLTLWPI